MKALYIERSTSTGRNGDWAESLDLEGVDRIVVGTGPGSFAGVRSALAFAKGFAIGSGCEVLGLPSPCAVAAQVFASRQWGQAPKPLLAAVGDARRGKFWIALFDGLSLVRDIFLVDHTELPGAVPKECMVVTTDEKRIGTVLAEVFGERYLGGLSPTPEGLKAFAESNPAMLTPNPLPIYLSPAVRTD